MNAMLVFVLAAQGIFAGFVNGWYYETPDKTLVINFEHHLPLRFFIYTILGHNSWPYSVGMFNKLSGVLDQETRVCPCLEFGEVGKSLVCDICRNYLLGSGCWHSA